MSFFSALFSSKPRPILIVEDDDQLACFLADVLSGAGYETIRASNGEEGVALARSAAPRLILLDMVMPVMKGLDALKIIKNDPKTRKTPVIMTTAEQKGQDVEDAFRLGASGYVIKPLRPEALLEKIRQALGEKKP